jgi:hypothetical protein
MQLQQFDKKKVTSVEKEMRQTAEDGYRDDVSLKARSFLARKNIVVFIETVYVAFIVSDVQFGIFFT